MFVGITRDSSGSSDEEYRNKELDEFIQKESIDSSDSIDEDIELKMMIRIQEKMGRKVKHILNFKCLIKGSRVLNRDRVAGAGSLYKYHFQPRTRFLETFFTGASVCTNPCFFVDASI